MAVHVTNIFEAFAAIGAYCPWIVALVSSATGLAHRWGGAIAISGGVGGGLITTTTTTTTAAAGSLALSRPRHRPHRPHSHCRQEACARKVSASRQGPAAVSFFSQGDGVALGAVEGILEIRLITLGAIPE